MRESHLVSHGPELVESVRGAIARGATTVVVGGGNGTVSSVVDYFANRPDLTLGLLPLGTGNEVARVLGIPLDLAGACRVVAEGRVIAVDLAKGNGNFFIHTALLGYPAHVNHDTPTWLKLRFGKAGYAYSLLLSIARAKPFQATMTVGSVRWQGRTVLVVVGNGYFHAPGSVLLPSSQAVKRGLLVYTPRDSRWTTLLRLAIGLWITHQQQSSLLVSLAADSAIVVTDPIQEVDLDGEFAQLTPVDFQLSRDALRVLVPDSGASRERM